MQFNILGEQFTAVCQLPFAQTFAEGELTPIDLSVGNELLSQAQIEDIDALALFIKKHTSDAQAKGAWGGYGEKRDLYRRHHTFNEQDGFRNIHLGVDFWLPAGTRVAAPLPGEVHSFADNHSPGNYGPTVVLMHQVGNLTFYSLYGHLSRTSLEGLEKGMLIRRGQVFGTLGEPAENVDWPPHLHFQLIKDMQGMEGDYPGVCLEAEKDWYLANCPNPTEMLGWEL